MKPYNNVAQAVPTKANPMDRYQKLTKLGEGTYGEVYKAIDKANNETVAIKRIRLEHEEEGVPGTAIREISLLRELNHKYIVQLKQVIHFEHRLHLIFEFCDTDLKKLLDHHSEGLAPSLVKKLLYQMIQGVHFCHCRRVLHRDLKPQNIFITNLGNPTVKLGDFGLARTFGIPVRQFTHEIVTLWYRSPEILLNTKHYSTAVDVWSIACIWAEMIAKSNPLFPGDCEFDYLCKIFEILGTPNEQTWPGVTYLEDWHDNFPKFRGFGLESILRPESLDEEGWDLIKKMLIMDPLRRISCKEALEHPYFAKNDFDKE